MSILTIQNPAKLHRYILDKVSYELSELVNDCHYPRIASLHNDLLHMTGTTDKEILKYSKETYVDLNKRAKWKLLYFPKNTLLLLITHHFIQSNDIAGAISTMSLLSMRFYSHAMHKYVKYCNPDYFKIAMRNISNNHLYKKKDTIGNSILFLAKDTLIKYKDDLKYDNKDRIIKLIYELATRIAQSARSFAGKYHNAYKEGESQTSKEEESIFEPTMEKKLKVIADKIAKDVTLYQKIDKRALDEAQGITKFNRKLSQVYVNTLGNHEYMNNLELAIILLLRGMIENKINNSQRINYIEYTKKLMSIKFTKKSVYFKGLIIAIHNDIIKDIEQVEWFNKLSVQAKATSRSFLAYYISLVVAGYFVK